MSPVITPATGHCKGMCAYGLDTKFRRQHISLSHPWSWAYIRTPKWSFQNVLGTCSLRLPPPAAMVGGQGGRWAREGQCRSSLLCCTETTAAGAAFFGWARRCGLLQRHAYLFKLNFTLHLLWQHVWLPWLGLQAHWDGMKIWCVLDHALCSVHWEYSPQVLITCIHIISHIIH